jgi:alanine racemase
MPTPIEARLAAAGLPPLPRTAWLELDLDALAANLAHLRSIAGAAVPVFPVVKADAYGHGAIPIARALAAAGADGLCVAALDEALELRAAGVTLPIRVLYPIPPGTAPLAAEAGVAVAAGDAEWLARMVAALTEDGQTRPALDLELEIETGLGRGGVAGAEAEAVARAVAASPRVRLSGLWTHLQATEDPAITGAQLARFDAVAANLATAGLELPPRHVAASGGILTDVVALDGIRPGLAIYGIVPDEFAADAIAPERTAALRPVMACKARPVRVADLPAGQGLSYGPTFTTARPSRIATLPLGYGDGFSRRDSNNADVLVRGGRVPLVGNVAMDGILVDVTDVPGPAVTIDDEFVLLGRQHDAEIDAAELARRRTTNTWEVVTQMAGRLPRVYHAASVPIGLRTLTQRSDAWLGSNSGTATSATSRSTPS